MTRYLLVGIIIGIIIMWFLTFLDKKFSNNNGVSAVSESYILDDGTYYSKTFFFGDVDSDDDVDCEETEEEDDDY